MMKYCSLHEYHRRAADGEGIVDSRKRPDTVTSQLEMLTSQSDSEPTLQLTLKPKFSLQ